MAINIRCDICYCDLNGKQFKEFIFAEHSNAGVSRKDAILVHLCPTCLTKDKRLNIYLENPYYKPADNPE